VQLFLAGTAAQSAVPMRAVKAVGAIALAASIGVQMSGLDFLRTFKRVNAHLAHATAFLTDANDVIVSDLFWFPQVTATLYPTRRLLFARSPDTFRAIAERTLEFGAPRLWLAVSTPLTGYVPPDQFAPPGGRARFVRNADQGLGSSGVRLYRYDRIVP
jgi:hypothetical protein